MTKLTRLTLAGGLCLLLGSLWLYAEPPAPELAQTATTEIGMADSASADGLWLHVEVETSYGWFWQKSTAKAFVTKGRTSGMRHAVGNLCMTLQAHDAHQQCLANADSIVIVEKKKGVGIPKRTAYVTAWTESPALDTTRVQMKP